MCVCVLWVGIGSSWSFTLSPSPVNRCLHVDFVDYILSVCLSICLSPCSLHAPHTQGKISLRLDGPGFRLSACSGLSVV